MTNPIAESELILNSDGSVYHLHLRPENLAGTVLLVGDPGRVAEISSHFDKVEFRIHNREFITHTGTFNGKRITALSTGIGTDNIDIVLNELDALVNCDLITRRFKEKKQSLDIIRIGTSGGLQEDIAVDSFVASSFGMGFDGLLHFYKAATPFDQPEIVHAFMQHSGWKKEMPDPYVAAAAPELLKKIAFDIPQGITATAPGFYGPQGRELRLAPALPDLNEKLQSFRHGELRITNFEMETSALYGLGKLLGHNCATVCAIVANRVTRQYSKNYKVAMDQLIRTILERLAV